MAVQSNDMRSMARPFRRSRTVKAFDIEQTGALRLSMMRRWLLSMLLQAILLLWCATGLSTDLTCADADADYASVMLFQTKLHAPQESTASTAGRPATAWAMKGGNLNHSAFAAFEGTHLMTEPSWIFTEPELWRKGGKVIPSSMKVFHGSPVIDEEKNVYIQSTTGWVYSLDKSGLLRWSAELTAANPGNLALLTGSAFTATQDGKLWSLDMQTGSVNWNSSISYRCPDDTHSVAAVQGTVLAACDAQPTIGNGAVCAASTVDGSLLWKYDMVAKHDTRGYNQAYVVLEDTVYFGDRSGGLYAVSIKDGSELWYVADPSQTSGFTTGGMVAGPNNQIYFGFNAAAFTSGILRAQDMATGKVIWTRTFVEAINAQPAVGPLGPFGRLAVIVAVGNNVECEIITHRTTEKMSHVYAIDAITGDTIWTYNLPVNDQSCLGNSLFGTFCCPDVFGQPTLAADGTAYVNWSAGYSFAIKDANGDGHIDATDPAEYSSYQHKQGSNGNTAVVPGLTVAVSCSQLMGYVS